MAAEPLSLIAQELAEVKEAQQLADKYGWADDNKDYMSMKNDIRKKYKGLMKMSKMTMKTDLVTPSPGYFLCHFHLPPSRVLSCCWPPSILSWSCAPTGSHSCEEMGGSVGCIIMSTSAERSAFRARAIQKLFV